MILIALAIGSRLSPNFLDLGYLLDTTSLYAEAGFLVLGMTLVIVSGQIDLSVAAMMALVASVFAKVVSAGVPLSVGVIIAISLGIVLGGINGLLVARIRLPSFVVTLATMAGYRGIAQILLGPTSEKVDPAFVGVDMVTIPGTPIPLPLAMLLVGAIIASVILQRSVLGRWITTTGTNERASLFSGVPTAATTTWVFVASGICAAIAGLLIDSRLSVARFDHASGLELDVITAVVLGGASIYGGRGTVLGSLLALALIALLRTELGLANITAETQLAAVGTLLIVAVLAGKGLDLLGGQRTTDSPD